MMAAISFQTPYRQLRAVIMAGVMLVLAGASFGNLRAQDKQIKVSVATQEISPLCIPSHYAREGGAPFSWKQAHLAVTKVQLTVPQTPVAVHTGDIDVGDCAGLNVVAQAWSKGGNDLIIVGTGAIKPIYVMIGGKKIKTLADLKNGKLGAPGVQSTAGEAISVMLKRGASLQPGRDYTFVTSGTGAARAAALAAGTIDGTSSYAPLSYKLADDGFPIIADQVQYVPSYVSGIIYTRRSWAEQNREALVALLKANIQIGQWIKDPANKEVVIALFAKTDLTPRNPMGEQYARRFYEDMVVGQRIAFNGYADEAAFQSNIDIVSGEGFMKREQFPPLDKLIEYSYLNQALKELGLPLVGDVGKR
jgi:ABC-type nitrate/sulfonate/bicarbonate transport system substrate-binding protein